VAAGRFPPAARLTCVTHSEDQTRRLGEGFGRQMSAPVVFALIGDLGSGKTMFVQGLARGLGVPDGYYVTSPSFTLINEYPGRWRLRHIDLYRLDADLDPDDLGLTDILKSDGMAAIEWADKLPARSLSDRLEVRFAIGEGDRRVLRFIAYGQDPSSLLNAFNLQGGFEWG
jgi:tRNA threonylcarbamoyladenosine biosynthesis protein TsaE